VFAALVLAVVGLALALHDRSSSGTGLRGSGIAATQVRHVAPFRGVELAGGTNVNVSIGSVQRVVVHADSNLLGAVTTRVVAGRLVVGNTGSFSTRSQMEVDVTVPELDALALSGGGILDARDVHAHTLALTLSGGGIAQATGTADALTVLLTGGGSAQLRGLVARDVQVRLTGAGLVSVDATDSLDATLTGAGSILYDGNPSHVTKDVTGTGVIAPG